MLFKHGDQQPSKKCLTAKLTSLVVVGVGAHPIVVCLT